MYQVSSDYLTQMMKKGTRRRLTGTIGNVPFTSNDVVQHSFSVSGRAMEESNTNLGGVYLGELEMTFLPSFLNKVSRTEFQNSVLTAYIGLLIDADEDIWEDIPVGVYTLNAPKISKNGITVTGYDNLQKLDKKFNIDTTSATPYGYLSFIATQCGVELGQTQEEIEALCNGTEVLGLHSENDIETFRDFLYWLAQACCCFSCADREGKIVLREFGKANGIEFDEMHRDTDVVFSGYTTKWTGLYVTDAETNIMQYYGLEVDDGLTMSLGANPLLQEGSADAVERRRKNILNAISEIQYTPFYCNSARDPIFDLGDEIRFTGGISGNCTGVVMAYAYTLDNFSFEGYGDDPALSNARSKTDKNISGLINSTVENEVTYYNYVNAEDIDLENDIEVIVASLAFTAAQLTTIKILHEFILNLSFNLDTSVKYEVRYYLDDELVPYSPYEYRKGVAQLQLEKANISIARDFFYVIKEVQPNIRHTWKVTIRTQNMLAANISANCAHVTLEGQRMYGEEYFDGFVEALDYIDYIAIGNLGTVNIGDIGVVSLSNAAYASVEDDIVILDIFGIVPKMIVEGTGELAPHIFLEGGISIATENELYLTTEDGLILITE